MFNSQWYISINLQKALIWLRTFLLMPFYRPNPEITVFEQSSISKCIGKDKSLGNSLESEVNLFDTKWPFKYMSVWNSIEQIQFENFVLVRQVNYVYFILQRLWKSSWSSLEHKIKRFFLSDLYLVIIAFQRSDRQESRTRSSSEWPNRSLQIGQYMAICCILYDTMLPNKVHSR